METVVIARLLRPRGNKGELAAESLSDSPGRFENLKEALVGGLPKAIENVWRHGEKLVFKFAGIDSISQAEALAGLDVSVPFEDRAPLEEGAYFQTDLLGCELVDRSTGRRIGVVRNWQEYGGPPLLEIEGEHGQEILVPFARSICVHIDLEHKRIEADLPEGLSDLNSA